MDFKDINNSKIALVYVYYERKNQQKNQTNFSFFLKYALDNKNWLNLNITYVFIINGTFCDVTIPKRDNIHVLHYPNSYYDYEGWKNGIIYLCKLNDSELWKNYDYLCLMNCSTCGPFMNENKNSHWLIPFYEKMVKTNSIICGPYMNIIFGYPSISCHMSLIKINNKIMNLIMRTKINVNGYKNTVLGKKQNKLDACLTGEIGLSKILIDNGYSVCCLYFDSLDDVKNNNFRQEFYNENTNEYLFNTTIFIKNVWRIDDNYASLPVLYNKCKNFIYEKLKIKDIFDELNFNENSFKYNLLNISDNVTLNHYQLCWNSKIEYYNLFGYAEEDIIFPETKKIINNSCIIYAHYDSKNILSDYVIQGLKVLYLLGYDIFFYSASTHFLNVDLSILPFNITFVSNDGPGTDWKIFNLGLKKIKNENLNYDWIMIMNDSLLFPINGIYNFANTILKMRNNCNFWGHWESREHNLHLIGVPIEFQFELIDSIIEFLDEIIVKCTKYHDIIDLLEVKFTEYLVNKNYKYNSIVKDVNLKGTDALSCPTHNPYIINQWINNKDAFAIKWKYCISYLNNNVVSDEFNYLTKFLHYGPEGIISKAELWGVFPKSADFIIDTNH